MIRIENFCRYTDIIKLKINERKKKKKKKKKRKEKKKEKTYHNARKYKLFQ